MLLQANFFRMPACMLWKRLPLCKRSARSEYFDLIEVQRKYSCWCRLGMGQCSHSFAALYLMPSLTKLALNKRRQNWYRVGELKVIFATHSNKNIYKQQNKTHKSLVDYRSKRAFSYSITWLRCWCRIWWQHMCNIAKSLFFDNVDRPVIKSVNS